MLVALFFFFLFIVVLWLLAARFVFACNTLPGSVVCTRGTTAVIAVSNLIFRNNRQIATRRKHQAIVIARNFAPRVICKLACLKVIHIQHQFVTGRKVNSKQYRMKWRVRCPRICLFVIAKLIPRFVEAAGHWRHKITVNGVLLKVYSQNTQNRPGGCLRLPVGYFDRLVEFIPLKVLLCPGTSRHEEKQESKNLFHRAFFLRHLLSNTVPC
jgi:hypothetical protein